MQSLIVWTLVLSLCLPPSLGQLVHAQQAPYDNSPQVDAPYYRVRYEGSQEEGKLVYPVAFTIWIPANVERLRGVVVHQHGCGEGSCLSGQTGAFDLHWQALASKHACGLLSPVYEQPDGADCQRWCDPRHGSDAAFQTALSDLGELSGHPELAEVPWALWGHSGGGHWAGGMLLLHPERVAAAWLRSGVPLLKAQEGRDIKPHQLSKAALSVPMMCNLGTQEGVTVTDGRFSGVWPANQQFFRSVRSGGGLIGVAIDPLTSHECGDQRYLAIPWFDACLLARLPDAPDQALKALSPESGWLADLPALAPTGNESVYPVPAQEFSGNIAESIWLPSQSIASAWTEYTNDTNVSDVTPPPEPANLRLQAQQLTWTATADLESGLAEFVIECNGKPIASVPSQPENRFGRPLFQGLQYSDTPASPLASMTYTLSENATGDVSQYRVRARNTAGLLSK